MIRRSLSFLALVMASGSGAVFAQGAQGGYSDLVKLDAEFLEFRKPKIVEGVSDRGVAAMEARRAGLEEFRKRLRAIDASSWSVPEKVDYL
ncbi:MAG TPA: hypothetical protein VJ921_06815, partial [Vicinamibacteria bacterium]|nr:hypothetical protein [Vicinamibacteria bacterium]